MRVQAKICGLTTASELDAAILGGASQVGFVFFAKSPRNIASDASAALIQRAAGRAESVGLFVNEDPALIRHIVREAGLDIVQLHGDESPEQAASIQQATGKPVWKAVPVRTRADLAMAGKYRSAASHIIYDAKPAPGSALPGGNGLRFDWKLLEGHVHPLPWILSGGLDANNVIEAVGATSARAVDVSSGVESAPGVKDVDKIAAFLQAVASL